MVVFAANGYGAPKNPENDGNLERYLGRLRRDARKEHPGAIVFCGGVTNRPVVSEARAMATWCGFHAPELTARLRLIESSRTARENIVELVRELRVQAKVTGQMRVIYYCEWTRRWEMRFYLSQLCPYPWKVRGVKFDDKSLELNSRLTRYLVLTPETVLAEYFPAINFMKARQRDAHIVRERMKA